MATEDWQWCVDWLIRCHILPIDHKATKSDSTVFDLAQALRDGVLICHLLNVLNPSCVNLKEFSQRPQMSQFLCLKNIRTFLHTCRRTFGIRSIDLFDSFDLFELREFKKVLHTLSKLSLSEVARRCGISGFPPDESLMHDHDYYNALEELANNSTEDFIYDVEICEEDAKIYDDLCSIRYSNDLETLTKREMCLNELVETEKKYVVALQMIVENFITPLKPVLTPQDMDLIFVFIEGLWDIHIKFSTELRKAVKAGSLAAISETFVKSKASFLVYGAFCSNLPKAQDHIAELIKNNENVRLKIEECQRSTNEGKFRLRDLLSVPMQRVLKYHWFLKELIKQMECQRSTNEGKFRLRDLLSVPMQRVLKYHLLLKELIKQTDKFSQDKRHLDKALEAMQDLSLYVNEVKRDNEALEVIKQIQNSIVDLQMPAQTTLCDYGRIQKDGELRVRAHGETKDKSRYLFLFDKVLLMCKSRLVDRLISGETYSFKAAVVLGEYRLEEVAPLKDNSRKSERWNSSFVLVKKDKVTAYTFYAKSEDMKTKWVEAITLALDNTHPDTCKKGLEFTMETFDKPTNCDVCQKLLRGVFFQGYFCNDNGMSVHKECISRACEPTVPPRPSPALPPNRPAQCRVRALQSYRGQPAPRNLIALKFDSDDVIEVLSRDKPDWWEGRLHGEVGYFPPQFVEIENRPTNQKAESYEPPLVKMFPAVSDQNGHVKPHEGAIPNLTKLPWYVGIMDRLTAERKLENLENGTFMIRESENPSRRGKYCLSLYFAKHTKHIKVEKTPENMYYIASCKIFHSIPPSFRIKANLPLDQLSFKCSNFYLHMEKPAPLHVADFYVAATYAYDYIVMNGELIEYYRINSLQENFPEVETTLVKPFKASTQKYAIAGYDYSANTTGQLSLRKGDRIKILSKAGEDKGWWKGELAGKIGYFPLAYVEEEE